MTDTCPECNGAPVLAACPECRKMPHWLIDRLCDEPLRRAAEDMCGKLVERELRATIAVQRRAA